jgi:glycosyltransferase involved in cell wall biosynthesis
MLTKKGNNTKKLKVAVVIGELTYIGGVVIAATREVEDLRKMGHEVELVVLSRNKKIDPCSIIDTKKIPVRFFSDELPRVLQFSFKFPLFSFFSFFHLTAFLTSPFLFKKHGYDSILVHETYNCLSTVFAGKIIGVRVISYFWDPVSYIVPRVYKKRIPKFLSPFVQTIALAVDKYILKYSSFVLIGSGLHKRSLKKIYPEVKFEEIPPGTEIKKNVNFKRDPIIVSLTKWDRGKNPEFLLAIVKQIKREFKLLIAGNWVDLRQREDFEEAIKRNGLEEKVKLLGRVTEEEKMALFTKARLLIHPIVEAFGMFALEAAACGCPFIIPERSGVTEIFQEKVQGFFPKEGDLDSYVKYINLLLNDQKLASRMGKSAWEKAKDYSWEAHARRIESVL